MAARGPQSTCKTVPNNSAVTFEPLEKLTSSTLKRNPKMELNKTDLLKLLSYLEGELQAREVVIAALKAEKVKQLLYQTKFGSYKMDDPLAALQRDAFAACSPAFDEVSVRIAYSNQLLALEGLMEAQRLAHERTKEQLTDAEQRQMQAMHELEEERRKHAQDTAQGDDVTYLLEKERERLRQEVELERQQNKKMEKEVRRVVAALEQERARHKQVVLLLLAERKRVIARLLEERHRCEELQAVLQAEKGRLADVVEGLEEESQKSLQMEAELEQQSAQFAAERAQWRQAATAEADRALQLQQEKERLTQELQILRNQLAVPHPDDSTDSSRFIVPPRSSGSTSPKPGLPPPPPAKPSSLHPPAKPPTNLTGISLFPGTGIQVFWSGVSSGGPATPPKTKMLKATSPGPLVQTNDGRRPATSLSPVPPDSAVSTPPVISTITKTVQAVTAASPAPPVSSRPVQGPVRSIAYAPTPNDGTLISPERGRVSQSGSVGARVSVTASPGSKVLASSHGGKLTFHVSTGAPPPPPPQPPKKPPLGMGRGVPPPVPPNKPVLQPQKKEVVLARPLPLSGSEEKALPKAVKLGITIGKDRITVSGPAASDTLPAALGDATPDGPQQVGGSPPQSPPLPLPSIPPSMDLLGQELADFQQLLVSMVAGKGIEIVSAEPILPAANSTS